MTTHEESDAHTQDGVTPEQLLRAIKLAAVFGVVGLVAVALALAIFVSTASQERAEICDVIRNVSAGNAEVLIRVTEPDGELTLEEQVRRDHQVEQYRKGIQENLGKCA